MAALALPLVLATGCGDDTGTTADDPEPTPTSSSPTDSSTPSEPATSPQCSEIWVDGQTFPERYRGCFEGAEEVPVDAAQCAFGTKLYVYDNRFYAVPNGPVNETDGPLAEDDAYKTAVNKCGG